MCRLILEAQIRKCKTSFVLLLLRLWKSTPDQRREEEMKIETSEERTEKWRTGQKQWGIAKNSSLPRPPLIPPLSWWGITGGNPNTAGMLSLYCISSIPLVNLIQCRPLCFTKQLCSANVVSLLCFSVFLFDASLLFAHVFCCYFN